MSPKPENSLLTQAFLDAESIGVRLEIIDGLGVWEASPATRHANAEERIAESIRRLQTMEGDCGCHRYRDLSIRFPGGSLRRPDISIFCRKLEDSDEAMEVLPEAVIEIVSKGSEQKDLVLSPGFYLRYGVKDVVVYDPYTKTVWHHRADRPMTHALSPVEITFECGCVATV